MNDTRQPQPTASQGEQQQHQEREKEEASIMSMTRMATTTTITTRLERLLAMEDALHGIEGYILSNHINSSLSGCLRNSDTSGMIVQQMMMRPPHSVWREKVTQWCYNVVDHLDECRSVVYVAMNILDRFTAITNSNYSNSRMTSTTMNHGTTTPCMMNERCFELASMSALFLAIRIAGNSSGGNNLQLSQLVPMTSPSSGIQSKHIVAMGTRIIQRLGTDYWRVRCVTPLDFLQTFFMTLTTCTELSFTAADQQEVLNAASFLCEIAVCDSVVAITERPSHIALAALLNALEAHFQDEEDDENTMSTGLMAMMERCTSVIPHEAQSLMRLRLRLQAVYGQTLDNSSSSQPRSAAGAAASLPHVVPQDVAASPTSSCEAQQQPTKGVKHCVSNDALCNNNKRPLLDEEDHVVLVMAAASSPSRKKQRSMAAHGNLPSFIHPDE